ncbi:ESX secretion-associated protein EspG [Allosaccharopolyspora coralli]|uniref:ESX secretion-associated protein EspG n=1 Tax=Allosaccharopolyspora coralli TaxID=2665642 RepID=A0A5Q3Q3V7_9PSEU|nr:ESX secretion-associated protein EspG [Allosaccharopolyspora coralli]QGK68510.1 ESX secretion-associated protein EspG [Allosaccharopolyspora coralli]
MVDTITLSIPAVDVLGEHLDLNLRQFPFEIPRPADDQERERVAVLVRDELETAGLTRSGRPEPELEDALYLLCSSEVAIAVSGLLDVRTGHRLAARVVATGEVGVLGLLDRGNLRLNFLAPDELPSAAVGLLPDAPAGSGSAVSAPLARPGEPTGEASADLAALTSRPKFRVGQFGVSAGGRRGQRSRLPGLTWFDTDRGRYSMSTEPRPDGQYLVAAPADGARLVGLLGSMLTLAQGR